MKITEFDRAGNEYTIVEAHGHPGRHHINLNRWNDGSQSYEGTCREESDMTLGEAKNYIYSRVME